MTQKEYFDFMMRRIKQTADIHGDKMPQAFGRWFANMYFPGKLDIQIPDGAGDGKVDICVTSQVGKKVRYHVLNTKFTQEYDKASPVSFYDEITRYWQAFENKGNRAEYLGNVVKNSLRDHYKKLFRLYDDGDAKLYFITNHRRNQKQYESVKNYDVEILHLGDVLEYVAENIEGAMPETDPLILSGISSVLTPATNESEVPTSIVFARLVDFIKYMEDDPFELLFARNVRLWLENTETNKGIERTFRNAPKEFAYSNNGITILCKRHVHESGKQELRIENPRVVNGSQTLHSVRNVENPSPLGRVMVRIIEVPPTANHDLPAQVTRRKEIIHKISIRSNLQNPIKRWNLVANDDFQNELARTFWGKKLYYERRQNEWKRRKLELKSVGIERGPDIRWMTQLIAAYYYDNKKLGPANAQAQLNTLFEEDTYSVIREMSPAAVYQLYLLSEVVTQCLKQLSLKKTYARNLHGHADLAVFSIVCKIIKESGLILGGDKYEKLLEREREEPSKHWLAVINSIVDVIRKNYEKCAASISKSEEKPLSIANYFKNRTMVNNVVYALTPIKASKAIYGILTSE